MFWFYIFLFGVYFDIFMLNIIGCLFTLVKMEDLWDALKKLDESDKQAVIKDV